MSNHQRHTTAPEDRVPWIQLIAYGTGGVIPIALFNIAPQLMSLIGNISLGLHPILLGAIMLVPKLWDAVSDPIIGHISDNTRTRWGRRRPYLLVGGLAVAVSFAVIWWVPRGDDVRALFGSESAYNLFQLAFILGGMLVFFTATTVFEIPHGALGMEMSQDYHERTRLFSGKSFFGNLFAMGTPWLIALAGWEYFRGPGGDLTDGMRFVSLFVAALLVPMVIVWFVTLREPGFVIAKEQQKTGFWHDMRMTASNRVFLILVAIIFTLAMGFNFVQIFSYYIKIFYLYGGDAIAAGWLLGVDGTVWAVTGVVAVFPLNWLGVRFGKNKTLIISILLMCAAQLSKIVCYNPEFPYLVLIPTMLQSGGMLMFFTLGSSMVGDVCDEDELRTGTRSEGSYYSVYWWFIKLGSAFAVFVMGALLVYTGFDARQNVAADALLGDIDLIKSEALEWQAKDVELVARTATLDKLVASAIEHADELREHFSERVAERPDQDVHAGALIQRTGSIRSSLESLRTRRRSLTADPTSLAGEAELLAHSTILLKQQTPTTLLRLRIVEIGLPLLLSLASVALTLRYPLTESRCYDIQKALKRRHANLTT